MIFKNVTSAKYICIIIVELINFSRVYAIIVNKICKTNNNLNGMKTIILVAMIVKEISKVFFLIIKLDILKKFKILIILFIFYVEYFHHL